MSQTTTEVAPSGGDSAVPQEVSCRQGSWVKMTVEDSDGEDVSVRRFSDPHPRFLSDVWDLRGEVDKLAASSVD